MSVRSVVQRAQFRTHPCSSKVLTICYTTRGNNTGRGLGEMEQETKGKCAINRSVIKLHSHPYNKSRKEVSSVIPLLKLGGLVIVICLMATRKFMANSNQALAYLRLRFLPAMLYQKVSSFRLKLPNKDHVTPLTCFPCCSESWVTTSCGLSRFIIT